MLVAVLVVVGVEAKGGGQGGGRTSTKAWDAGKTGGQKLGKSAGVTQKEREGRPERTARRTCYTTSM